MAVDQQAEQGRQQRRHHAVGEEVGPGRQAAGQQAFGQLQHQAAVLRVLGELDADVGQLVLQAPAHGPVELAHEGQVAGFLGVQQRAVEAFQARAQHRHPGVFAAGQVLAEARDAGRAFVLPGLFGLLRVLRQVVAVGRGEEVGAALHRQAPGIDEPGEQQAEADLQKRQLPQQGMAAHQERSVSTSR